MFISQNAVALFSQLEPFSPRLVCVYYQNVDVASTSSSTSRYITNQQIHIDNQQVHKPADASLLVVQPVYSFAPLQPIVFAFRLSQFVPFLFRTVYSAVSVQRYITSFVASISLERTVLQSVQIPTLSADSHHVQLPSSLVFESPIVQIEKSAAFADTDEQMDIDLSDDSSLHFDDNDAATASISLPTAPIPDITEALNQLRASIEQISERDDGAKHKDTLLLHLRNFERNLTARLDAQDRVLGALRKDSNDQRSLMSLDIKSSHKQLSTQIAATALDVVDVQRVVRKHHQELNAKITSLDDQVAATRNDLLDFSAQAQQTLNIITDQLSELVAYINRGGNEKKGEVSSSRPQPPPDDQKEEVVIQVVVVTLIEASLKGL
ncbi:ankyrin repeat-containing protein-like [Dorcoceras hygrometricum]|uniref:Ankyrin repeat-containing protein-like n=1 Tax=Dorcoceras hygrometricum TaxID=472368 RepID=A0A2Z7A418_9LAMI|nr:ankyrin repeat-containing protein-like [Dorcoceras hygrometricum]